MQPDLNQLELKIKRPSQMNDFKNFKAKLDEKKGLWDNIHAKRKRGEKPNPPGHPDRPTAQDFKDAQKTSKNEAVEEKKLTPAEMKKREEIARAMERENPGMDKSKKMAIATAAAKRVAEEADQLDELSKKTLGNYIRAAGPDREAKLKKAQQHTNTGHQLKQYADDKKSLRHAQQHFQISGELQGKAANRKIGINKAVDRLTKEEAKPDAVEVMRKKQQMANISTSDKDKLAKIRAMLNKEKKPEND